MRPECRYIMTGGEKCHSIALRGTKLCHLHTQLKRAIDQAAAADSDDAVSPATAFPDSANSANSAGPAKSFYKRTLHFNPFIFIGLREKLKH
jgi:hypothetical protein